MEMLATTATGINKISMQIRRGGRAVGQRSGGVALVALMRIGHGAERPTEFTTRRRFVRTDASREITLVSPLAASGRRAAAMPGRVGCLLGVQSRQVALVGPNHDRKSQVVLSRAASGAGSGDGTSPAARRRVCFSMMYTCSVATRLALRFCVTFITRR